MEWRAFESAYELTQFVRGTLFTTLDTTLTQRLQFQTEKEQAHFFVKEFIVLVIGWLKWVAANPQIVRLLLTVAQRTGILS